MPRHARFIPSGHPVHIYQRGHDKHPCFRGEADHLLYLTLLRESAALYPLKIHAFVLMTNHVHLVASPAEPIHLSRVMKRLNERYAIHFNRKYQRTGSVWEGRFKTSIIDTDSYLLCCQRYTELNPVRAGMVSHPSEYPWSSYRANAHGEISDIVTPHPHFLMLSEDPDARRTIYRSFVAKGSSDVELAAIRAAISSCTALGREEFLTSLPDSARRRPQKPGRPKRLRAQLEMPL